MRKELPANVESFNIDRALELIFTEKDPEDLDLAGWGDTQLGGVYKEQIQGVHKDTIFIEGVFRIARVSTVSVLNDGM